MSEQDDHTKKVLATYDRMGEFDLSTLKVTVVKSGLEVFDRNEVLTEKEGRLITVGAYTSHGKTALMMQLAAHVSKTKPVIVHSFEMSKKHLEMRLLASVAGVSSALVKNGSLPSSKVALAKEEFKERRLYLSNIRNTNLSFVMSSVYEMSKVVGQPGLVVIDYGQQVSPGTARDGNRTMEITDTYAGLLQLSMQLNCNVMVGAQLNNEILRRAWDTRDKDGSKEYIPMLADLREGSTIAHNSDTVIVVTRPGMFDLKKRDNTARIFGLKTRGVGVWQAELGWEGSKCQFYERGESETGAKRQATIGI